MDSLGHLIGIVDNLAMASQAMLHGNYDKGSIFFYDLIDEAESIFQKANLTILTLFELRMNEAHSSTPNILADPGGLQACQTQLVYVDGARR